MANGETEASGDVEGPLATHHSPLTCLPLASSPLAIRHSPIALARFTQALILDLKVCDPAMGSGAFLVEACRQLGDALVEAWHAGGEVPPIPPDEDEVIYARRLIAQRCLYGVDRNPVAVDLAKVSLWLVTLAKDHALTFVDHALRHGDSLVGLSRKQIEAFHWSPVAQRFSSQLSDRIREQVGKVSELRRLIREADDKVPDQHRRHLWDEAQFELGKVRLYGDLVLAAYFEGGKPKDRERKRSGYVSAVVSGEADRYRGWLEERRHADPPLAPFHWEIEFPEVFERENPGFDAIVGNPPFQGGRNLTATQGEDYSQWLLELHEGSSGGSDLVAHFFRRAFDRLRQDGAFGLIATNTIGQGDTRSTGLRWICQHGGEIYATQTRVKWPGLAAVVVSVLHVKKGAYQGPKRLDGREVATISAFLFHRGGHDDPAQLAANAGKSFQGSIVLGMGFTFDDTDTKGVANPLAEMRRLIEEDPKNQEVIFPYIGGEEVNTSPTHAHDRYVINFGERGEDECRERWPELMAIVEGKVKPERITKDAKKYPRMVHEWWKFWNSRQELQVAIAGLDRVLVICRHQPQWCAAFLPTASVFAESLLIFPLPSHAGFCALQSRPHEVWARFFGSSLEDRLRYTPSDCFETFPFPEAVMVSTEWRMADSGNSHSPFATHYSLLCSAGQAYYEFRAALMVRNDEGLTKTYNRFHDPDERAAEIVKLRELHAAMDRAVLDAYGWTDIPTECEFLLDYEIDEEEWGNRKKPYRYRWSEKVHDEVLARLLELNAERAREEARSGAAGARKKGKGSGAKRKITEPGTGDLFS